MKRDFTGFVSNKGGVQVRLTGSIGSVFFEDLRFLRRNKADFILRIRIFLFFTLIIFEGWFSMK